MPEPSRKPFADEVAAEDPLAEGPSPPVEPPEPPLAGSDPLVEEAPGEPKRSAASVVAGGIFSSRILGLARTVAEGYFFGASAHGDVLQVAFKGPNLLQNLLGEGTLSAAFIPTYSAMLKEGRAEEAGRFAGAIFGLLLAVATGVALLGFVFAEAIVSVIVPGWADDAAKVAAGEIAVDRFALLARAIRYTFPMAALLVLSAWALGVLNSHRRFFLPYFAPVAWNAAILAAMFAVAFTFVDGSPFGLSGFSDGVQTQILFGAFAGALVGGALQFGVQLPLVAKELTGFRLSFSTKVPGVRQALRAFGPVVAGRGVYQISTYLDIFLAGWLAAGALSSLRYALVLYLLPVSLFGLSVAASELPELSRITGEEMRPFLRRLDKSMSQVLFLTVPTFVGYLGLGLLIVSAVFERGTFGTNDAWLVYAILCGYSLGLVATTVARLLQNAFYALGNTKTPARIAAVRVVVSAMVAVPLMFTLDRFPVAGTVGFFASGRALYFGAVGLAVGATAGAWVELWHLLAALRRGGPSFRLPWGRCAQMVGMALAALGPAAALWWALPAWPALALAPLVVGAYAAAYLGLAHLLGFSELKAWTHRFF